MDSRRKQIWIIVVVVVVVVVIGFLAWTLRARAPETQPSGSSTSTVSIPASSTVVASGTQMSVSSTGGLTVTLSTSTNGGVSSVWEPYSSDSVNISLDYPPGWILGTDLPLSFDNFGNNYQNNEMIPAGGAEIDVVSVKNAGPDGPIIQTETMDDTVNSTSSVTVDHVACTQVSYTSNYGQGYPSNNIGVYCPDASNGLLYKIYLSYHENDPKGTTFLTAFQRVLDSISFTQ